MNKLPVALFIALLFALSACGGSAAPDAAGTQGSGEDPGAAAAGDKDGEKAGKGSGERSGGGGGGNGSNSDSSGPGSGGGGGSQTARSRPGISTVRDPAGDAEKDGDVPAWVDLTGGTMRDEGTTFLATAVFASTLPDRMPDETHVAQVSLHLALPKENAYLYAEGRPDGWKAYVSRRKKARELPPDSFAIRGNEMTWRVPWSAVGDPRRLGWGVHLSWTHTTLLRVNYAFDSAPDSGTEGFRRR